MLLVSTDLPRLAYKNNLRSAVGAKGSEKGYLKSYGVTHVDHMLDIYTETSESDQELHLIQLAPAKRDHLACERYLLICDHNNATLSGFQVEVIIAVPGMLVRY